MEAIKHPPNLEDLFRDTAADLARYFSRRHEGKEIADDLVQETFLKMAESVERGKRPEHLRAYLFGVARHVSHAAWRQKSKDSVLADSVSVNSVAAEDSRDSRVDAACEMINLLPSLQREILDLRFNQNLTYAEIAEALEIPVGTVRSRLHNAVSMIRDRLDEDNPDTPPNS